MEKFSSRLTDTDNNNTLYYELNSNNFPTQFNPVHYEVKLE